MNGSKMFVFQYKNGSKRPFLLTGALERDAFIGDRHPAAAAIVAIWAGTSLGHSIGTIEADPWGVC